MSWNELLETTSVAAMTKETSMNIYHGQAANETESETFIWVSKESYGTIIQAISSVIFCIATCGVILNTLNIKTFILMGLKDGVTVSFMCLATSDFCATMASFIMSTSRLFMVMEEQHGYWFPIDPFAVHLFSMNISVITNFVTTLNTSFIAIARCMCVALPFKFKDTFTRKRCVIAFCCFFTTAIGLWIPVYMNMGIMTSHDPVRNATRLVLWLGPDRAMFKDIVGLIMLVPVAIIVEVIIIVCVIIMAAKLRESLRFRQGEHDTDKGAASTKLSGKEKNVVIQVVTISIIFIFCNFVKMTHAVWTIVDDRYEIGNPGHYLYMTLANGLIMSDCFNNSANFFVYYIFNSRFRALCFKCKS